MSEAIFLWSFFRPMPTFCLQTLRFPPFLRRISLLLLLGIVSGCDAGIDPDTAFAPACPHFDVPGSVADQLIYDGRGLDPAHRVSSARILAIQGDCRNGPRDEHKRPLTRVRLSLKLQLDRGPASQENLITVPYFVAILQDGKIIDKKMFTETLSLPNAVSSAQENTPLRLIDLPMGDNPQISPYSMEIGLQLTHDQVKYNRSHLRSVQFHEHVQ